MDCRTFRSRLREVDPQGRDRAAGDRVADRLDEEARRHAAACAGCAADLRALSLLAFGSPSGPEAGLRPGFEERLKARLASGPARSGASWLDAIDWLARPSLGIAAALLAVTAGVYVWVAPRSSPSPSADLALLVEGDPVLDRLLSGESVGLLESPSGENAAAATSIEEGR